MDIKSRGKTNVPPRVLGYRKQVKIASACVKYISYILLLTSLALFFAYLFKDQESKTATKILAEAIVLGVTWLVVYLEYLFFVRPFAMSKFQAYGDRILIRRGKKEIIIPFDDVVEIKSSVTKKIGGMGSFKLILKSNKKYLFTIVLERSDYILDAIYKYNPDLMKEDEYIKLRKKLIQIDHGQSRIYEMFGKKYRLHTFTHILFLPCVFFVMIYAKQSGQFIIHSPTQYFFKIGLLTFIFMASLWVIFVLIIEKIIEKPTMKRLEKDIENKIRDTKFESKIYRRIYPAYLLLLLVFFGGVYKTDLNTLGRTSLVKGSKELNIKAGERLWYDSRYNCTDCNYKLEFNDFIMTKFGVAKIVGLPNEKVTVNVNLKNRDKQGRFIASVEEKQIPQKSIAVKTANGSVIIVEDRHVKGKIFRSIPHLK